MLSCSTDRTVKLWDADPRPDGLGFDIPQEFDDEDEDDQDMTTGGSLRRGGLLSSRDKDVPASEVSPCWVGPCRDRKLTLYDHSL